MLSATNLEEFRDAVPPLSKKIESVTAPKDPASAKLEVVRKILSGIDDSARYLSEIPLSIDQRRDNLTISLGYGDGEPIRFPFPLDKTNDSSQAGELTKYARTLGVEFRADLTVNKLIADFEKEHPPSGIPR